MTRCRAKEPKIRALVTLTLALVLTGAANAANPARAYAQQLAAKQGWTGYQWNALDAIIRPESGWNPCARFPSRSECYYAGYNSCGIPQRNPCPAEWRGRLGATWKAQVEWLIRYIRGRYGTPANALAYRRSHGYY